MNYNNPIPNHIMRGIRIACAVLFVVFSFSYLYFLEGDLLAQAQYVYSGGVTTYSRLLGAILITFCLLCVQLGVEKVTKLTGRAYAMSYFPSLLLLSVITSINKSTIEQFSLDAWAWALPLALIVYAAIIWVMRHFPDGSVEAGDYSIARYMWPNMLIMFLMMVLCGARGTADDVYMYELKAERLVMDEDYEAAGKVGMKSLNTSRRLNELRLFALANEGTIGEYLFSFPQPYGSEGLIDLADTSYTFCRFNAKDIQRHLDGMASPSITTAAKYIELMAQHDTSTDNKVLGDYYLCSLLLDKNLRTFTRKLRVYYSVEGAENVMALPKAYREALLLQAKNISNDSLMAFADTLMLNDYLAYRTIMEEETDSLQRANLSRKKFGNTLWRYFDYH